MMYFGSKFEGTGVGVLLDPGATVLLLKRRRTPERTSAEKELEEELKEDLKEDGGELDLLDNLFLDPVAALPPLRRRRTLKR